MYHYILQAVKKLLLYSGINIYAKNLEEKTAGDILVQQNQIENREIKVMLRRVGAIRAPSLPGVTYYARYLWSMFSHVEKARMHCLGEWTEISDDRRNMLFVVATLLMTVTYQGVLSLLGDFGKMTTILKPIVHYRPSENSIQVLLFQTKQGHPLVLENFLFGCCCH